MRRIRRQTKRDCTSGRTESVSTRIPVAPGWWALSLAVLVLLTALRTIQNLPVLYDDPIYLGRPAVIGGLTWQGFLFAFTSVSDLYWHPLTWLSHETDVSLFAMNPAGHHLVSAALHSTAAGFLFLVLRKLGADTWASAAGTLLWAIHPLRVESFAWLAERKDVLCALFFIAAVLAYLNYSARPSRGRYLAWVSLGALALMSKPTGVCLIPILFLLDYWPLRRPPHFRNVIEKLPILILTIVVVGLTIAGQRESGAMSHLAAVPLSVRIENIPVFYVRYIGKMIWPVDLGCFYAYDAHPIAIAARGSSFALVVITVVAVRLRHRQPWLLFGWIWFLVCLIPNIGLLQAGRQSIADRFTNLSMIGIAAGLAMAMSAYIRSNPQRRKVTAVAVSVALAILASLTIRQIGYWHDSVQLFEHALSVEDSDYVRANLALGLITERRYAEAEPHLSIAVRRSPEIWDNHNNLANVLLQLGRVQAAADEAATAVRLAPGSTSATETLGLILFRKQDYQGTLKQFDRLIELGASRVPVAARLSDMGAAVASRGQPGEAEPLIRRALDLDPRLVQGWKNLALVMINQGRMQEARSTLHEAVRFTGSQPGYDKLLEVTAGQSP